MVIEIGGAVRENEIYVIPDEFRVLAACNLQTEEWKVLCRLPEDFITGKSLLLRPSEGGKELYLISRENAGMLCYRFDTGLLVEYSLHLEEKEQREDYVAASVLDHGADFIFLPFRGEKLIVFNKMSCETNIYVDWKRELAARLKEMELDILFIRRDSSCIIGDYLYATANCKSRDIIFSICLTDMKLHQVYKINISGRLFGMELDGNAIWIQNNLSEGSRFIYWNPEKDYIEKKTVMLTNINRRVMYLKSLDHCLCAGFIDGKILVIDKETYEIKKYVEGKYLYSVWNKKGIIGSSKAIKLLDLDELEFEQVAIPDSIFLDVLLALVSENERKLRKGNTKSAGGLIFDTLCSGMQLDWRRKV